MATITLVSEIAKQSTNVTGVDSDGYDRVDGVRVNPNLYQFALELRKNRAFRECKFGIRHTSGAHSLFVYFPHELYCRGEIGYGDIGINEVIIKYHVDSKLITNNKIASWRSKHTTKSTQDLKKALVLARKYLREYTLEDMYRLTSPDAGNVIDESKGDANSLVLQTRRVITNEAVSSGVLTDEFRNMISVGYTFKHQDIKDKITAYLDAIDSFEEVKQRDVDVKMVVIYPKTATVTDPEIRVMDMGKIRLGNESNWFQNAMSRKLRSDSTDVSNITYKLSTVPTEIKSALQSLAIVDVGEYVEGLGYRTSDNIFYLIQG